MSLAISIQLTPESQAVIRGFQTLPARMMRAIARAMDKQNVFVAHHINTVRMTGRGPYPVSEHRLGAIHNRLRASVDAWVDEHKAEINGNTVTTSIGSNVSYAAAHEFGFDGMVAQGRNAQRHGTSADVYKLGGKEVTRAEAFRRGWLLTKANWRAAHDRVDKRLASGEFTARQAREYHRSLSAKESRQRGHRIAVGFSTVRAHERHMRIPERAPIRYGIMDVLDDYGLAISEAILAEANNPEGAS
jgi:phage gpG-like protein